MRTFRPIHHRAQVVRALMVGCLWLAYVAVAQACNVPVFRFALERWAPDPYRVTLLHQGPLDDAVRGWVRPFEERAPSSPNFTVRTIDVGELDAVTFNKLVASEGGPQFPYLVVQYPPHLRIEMPVWRGTLVQESIDQLSNSPVRQELVRRLAQGQTAVWLLLETGQTEVDDEVAARLEVQLQTLQQELKLPKLTDAPEDGLLTSTPLRIEFSVLRVPRSDSERALVEMLIRSESDLAERSDPMVFPVFGRGRALFPLVGPGITDENIHESAAFLVGPCSCQIKELNPGFDLMLAADWDRLLIQDGALLTANVPSPEVTPDEPVLVPIPSGSSPPVAVAVAERGVTSDSEGTAVTDPSPLRAIVTGLILGTVAALVAGFIVAHFGRRAAH